MTPVANLFVHLASTRYDKVYIARTIESCLCNLVFDTLNAHPGTTRPAREHRNPAILRWRVSPMSRDGLVLRVHNNVGKPVL